MTQPITICEKRRTKLLKIAKNVLVRDNLKINESKTEHTVLKGGDKLSESWRNTKKLGSLLGSSEDIMRRKQLSIAATRNLDNIWIRNTSIRKTTRIKLYKTLIKPILLYNCGTWGITKSEENSLI